MGVHLIKLGDDSQVATMTRVAKEDEGSESDDDEASADDKTTSAESETEN